MSCCLNHCIIADLIPFLASPHTRSAGLLLLEPNGQKDLSEQRIGNIFLEIGFLSAYVSHKMFGTQQTLVMMSHEVV